MDLACGFLVCSTSCSFKLRLMGLGFDNPEYKILPRRSNSQSMQKCKSLFKLDSEPNNCGKDQKQSVRDKSKHLGFRSNKP